MGSEPNVKDDSWSHLNLACPSCGEPLDVEKQLQKKFKYQIVLAVGLVCPHCNAKIRIERNVPTLDF